MRARDQSGPPIPADVGHLHDLEHRLSSSWLHDKLGDIGQGFWGELAYEVELVPSDNNPPDGMFKGGMKGSQLFGVLETKVVLESRVNSHCVVPSDRLVNCIRGQGRPFSNNAL